MQAQFNFAKAGYDGDVYIRVGGIANGEFWRSAPYVGVNLYPAANGWSTAGDNAIGLNLYVEKDYYYTSSTVTMNYAGVSNLWQNDEAGTWTGQIFFLPQPIWATPVPQLTPSPTATPDPSDSLCGTVLDASQMSSQSPFAFTGGDYITGQVCQAIQAYQIGLPWSYLPEWLTTMIGVDDQDKFVIGWPDYEICIRTTEYQLVLFYTQIPLALFINVVLLLAIVRLGVPELVRVLGD